MTWQNLPWWKFLIPATVTRETRYSTPNVTEVIRYERWLNLTWGERHTWKRNP